MKMARAFGQHLLSDEIETALTELHRLSPAAAPHELAYEITNSFSLCSIGRTSQVNFVSLFETRKSAIRKLKCGAAVGGFQNIISFCFKPPTPYLYTYTSQLSEFFVQLFFHVRKFSTHL